MHPARTSHFEIPLLFASLYGLASGCGGTSTTNQRTQGSAGKRGAQVAGAPTAGSSTGGATTGGSSGTAGKGSVGGTAGDSGSSASGNGGGSGTSPRGGAGGTGGNGSLAGAGALSPGGVGGEEGNPGGSGGGESGAVATLGGECSTPGELACAGQRQKVALICGGSGQWETSEICGAGEFCSSVLGQDAGTCLAPDVWCADKEPNARGCDDKDVRVCDADGLVGELVKSCPYLCVDGECDDSCAEGVVMNCTEECGGPTRCSDVCKAGLDGAAPAPLLFEPSAIEPGVVYTLRMPATKNEAACPLACANFAGAPGLVAVRLPRVPGYPYYQIKAYNLPWAIEVVKYPKGVASCVDMKPEAQVLSNPSSCTTLEWFETDPDDSTLEYQLWLYAFGANTEPPVVTVEVGAEFPDAEFDGCPAPTWP